MINMGILFITFQSPLILIEPSGITSAYANSGFIFKIIKKTWQFLSGSNWKALNKRWTCTGEMWSITLRTKAKPQWWGG